MIIEVICCISIILMSFSIIGMLTIYRSMERSLEILTKAFADLSFQFQTREIGRSHGNRVQSMAEDTKVEQ